MGLFDSDNYLLITDLQIPFEHPKALPFCKRIKKEFKIKDDNVYNLGDETDQIFGGMYRKDVNGYHTATSEHSTTVERLMPWYDAFPRCKLNISNHGTRWMRKAFEAEIPEFLFKRYEKVIEAPRYWKWARTWKVNCKYPFMTEHGDNWGGQTPHISAAIHNGCSTAMGHHHSLAGIQFVKTAGQDIWGAVGGCLINFEEYAFNYARNARLKPQIGVIVVLNSGKTPIWVPLE